MGSVTRERWAIWVAFELYNITNPPHSPHTFVQSIGQASRAGPFSLPTMAHSTLVLSSWTLLGGQINSSVLLSFTSFIFPTHLCGHSQYQSPWSQITAWSGAAATSTGPLMPSCGVSLACTPCHLSLIIYVRRLYILFRILLRQLHVPSSKTTPLKLNFCQGFMMHWSIYTAFICITFILHLSC